MSRLPDISGTDAATAVVAQIRSALHRRKVEPVPFMSHVDIQHEGDRPKAMYLVKSGWVYSYALLADGQRQILYLHQAGDIAGLADFGVERACCSMRSLGDCVVLPIPNAAIATPDFLTPDIVTYFLQKSAQMQSVLMRTLIAVGRMEARHRIVWLILMLHDRLPHAGVERLIVEIPFNQSEIGDLIGLTNVSVSKILCQLSDEGFIERKGRKVLLRRRSDMQHMIGYEPMRFSANRASDAERIAPTPGAKRRIISCL